MSCVRKADDSAEIELAFHFILDGDEKFHLFNYMADCRV